MDKIHEIISKEAIKEIQDASKALDKLDDDLTAFFVKVENVKKTLLGLQK